MAELQLRILLVTADPGLAGQLLSWLAAAGLAEAQVLAAPPDGPAPETPIDVLVLDLAAGGAGVRRHWQTRLAATPLIGLASGHADAEAARPHFEPGTLLTHPVEPALLGQALRQASAGRLTERLEASEARFRNIIQRNADGILVADLDGRVQFANPAAEALLGRTAAELVGQPFGFPIVSGETTEVDVLRRGGQASVAEMRVVETQWEGQPAVLASLRDITERKRVEVAEREQRALAEALRDTAAALASTLEFEAVLDRILENVGRVTPHETAGIMLLETPGVVRVVRSRGYKPSARPPLSPLRRIDEWAGLRHIAATLQPLVVPDTGSFPDWVSGSATDWVRSYVGAPLRVRGQVIGFINLSSSIPHFFAPIHAERLQVFADQAAVAIENARLYDARQQQADEIAALYRASGLLVGPTTDLPALAAQIAHAVLPEFPEAACGVWLRDEAGAQLTRVACAGLAPASAPAALPLNGPELAAAAARAGEPIYIPEIAAEPRYAPTAGQPASALAAPLRAAGRVIGVLELSSPTPDAFAGRGQRLVSALAERAGLALENARLYREAVRAGERRAALYWAAQAISASLDHEQLCAAVHRAAAQIMAVEALTLVLRADEPARTEDVFHFEHGRRANSGLSTALARIHAHIMATGVTVRGNHFEPAEFDAADRAPLRAILAVPLRAGDRLLGLLAVQGSTPDAYSADDQMLLEMLAAQAAIAFENARLFANTQRLANLDPLTRLYNRRHFFDLGQREFERVARYHSPLTILIADIDHFKRVNDTRGHLAGDQVLRAVAAGFRESLRDVDIIGRYGGEEFVVLMPETDMPEARRAGERLMQRLAHAPIPTDRGPVSVTLSLGLAEMEAGYDISLETLLDRADQALYAAKQAGRDRLVCWDSRLPFRSQFGPAPA